MVQSNIQRIRSPSTHNSSVYNRTQHHNNLKLVCRVFELTSPSCAIQTHNLDNTGDVSPSKLRIQHALGEAAVCFDFGPPVEVYWHVLSYQ